ncbi:IQ domain-containing protein M [Lissotriton helveticus]
MAWKKMESAWKEQDWSHIMPFDDSFPALRSNTHSITMQRTSASAPPGKTRKLTTYGSTHSDNSHSQQPFPSVSLIENPTRFAARARTAKCSSYKWLPKSADATASRRSQQTNAQDTSKQEESIKLWDVLNILDAVTHEMEFEKKKGDSPVSGIMNSPKTYMNIPDCFKSKRQSTVDTIYQDWRGVVSQLSLKSRQKDNTRQKDSVAVGRGILRCNKQATKSSIYTEKSDVDHDTKKSMDGLKNTKDFRVAMNNNSLSPKNHTDLVVEKKGVYLACSNHSSANSEVEHDCLKTDENDNKASGTGRQSKLDSVNEKSEHKPDGSEITLGHDLQSSTRVKKTTAPSSQRTHGLFVVEGDKEKVQQNLGDQRSCVVGLQKEGVASSGNAHQNVNASCKQVTQETYSKPSPKPDSKFKATLNYKNTQESCFRINRGMPYQCKEVEGNNGKKHGMKEWIYFLNANKYSQERIRKEKMQGAQKKLQRINVKSAGSIKHIGPHVEVYEAFNKPKEEPISRIFAKAAIKIQKWVRGWLVRSELKRIKAKAEGHGPSLVAVVEKYRKMMKGIHFRLGFKRRSTPLIYAELEEWLDRKTMYENMFCKREFWKEMDKSELSGFFRDCGHFPTRQHIDNATVLFNQKLYGKQAEVFRKHQVIELAFTLYPPLGARVSSQAIRKSTWIHPIVNGKEGNKFIVSGHPILKKADIRVVGELVAASIRERKERLLPAPNPQCDG